MYHLDYNYEILRIWNLKYQLLHAPKYIKYLTQKVRYGESLVITKDKSQC